MNKWLKPLSNNVRSNTYLMEINTDKTCWYIFQLGTSLHQLLDATQFTIAQ